MSVHVTPIRVYLMVFGILMVGTALTVWAAFLHLGPFNDVVALAIAVTKATFVVLYFMHADALGLLHPRLPGRLTSSRGRRRWGAAWRAAPGEDPRRLGR